MIVPTARRKKKTGLSINKNNVNKLKSKRRTRESAAATRRTSSFSQLWITSQCFAWFSPVCPPKLIFTSLLQSAVLISDAGMSPGVLQSCPLFSRFNISVFRPAVTRSVQRLESCSITSSMFPSSSCLHIYFSFVFPTSQLWKRARTHTDAVVYVSRVFMLFIVWSIAFTELCSNRCRFIYYDENFHCEIVSFFFKVVPPVLVSSATVCPVHLSSTACG